MTKRELIEKLKDYSDDALIIVNGHSHSSDYCDCHDVEEIRIKAYKSYSWRGQYTPDFSYPDASEYLHPDIIEAVVIH